MEGRFFKVFLSNHFMECYTFKSKVIGSCGACSFINLVGLKGSAKLEKELAEGGRMKPSWASDFTSFLLWGEKYGFDFKIFVERTFVSKEVLEMMIKYENISKNEQEKFKKEVASNHNKIVKRNKDKINLLNVNPLRKIDSLLRQNYSVAFAIADKIDRDFLVGHMRVAYGMKKKKYLIKDSVFGLMELTQKEMKRHLNNLKEINGNYEIIACKN